MTVMTTFEARSLQVAPHEPMAERLRLMLAEPIEEPIEPTPCPSWCRGNHDDPAEAHVRGVSRDGDSYIGRSEYNGRADVFASGYGDASLGFETFYTLDEAARLGRGLLDAVALGRGPRPPRKVPPRGDPMTALMTTAEAAEVLGVDVRTLYGWRRRLVGPPIFRVIDRVVYDADELNTWRQEHALPTA